MDTSCKDPVPLESPYYLEKVKEKEKKDSKESIIEDLKVQVKDR